MKLTRKLVGDEDERAVSPVIGVILMVAITVILAAVIAAFVLDLGQSQSANVNAGVSWSEDGSTGDVTVQLTDMGNAEEVEIQNNTAGGGSETLDSVGATAEFNMSITDSLTAVARSGSDENVIGNWP